MTIQHSAIADADRHEPKGITTAAAGSVYVSNGDAISGTWQTSGQIISYGELYASGGTQTQTLNAVADTYNLLNPTGTWQAGVYNKTTLTPASGSITISETGVYNVSFWIVFLTAALAAGTRYKFKYAINGTVVNRIISTSKETTGADVLDTGASGLASLTAGDVITIYVAGDATSANTLITVQEAGFTLHKI